MLGSEKNINDSNMKIEKVFETQAMAVMTCNHLVMCFGVIKRGNQT